MFALQAIISLEIAVDNFIHSLFKVVILRRYEADSKSLSRCKKTVIST